MNPVRLSKWDKAFDKMEAKLNKAIAASGQEKHVIYSAYDNDKYDIPLDNLDQIAVEGKCILVGYHDKFYSEASKDYFSPVLENPTWLQVAVLANQMIEITGDMHHVFLENLTKKGEKDGVPLYEFAMGS